MRSDIGLVRRADRSVPRRSKRTLVGVPVRIRKSQLQETLAPSEIEGEISDASD